MQSKYTIKRNTVKKVIKSSSSANEEIKSSSITRKSLSDEIHINIITSSHVDTSNSSRLLSPIAAEAKKHTLSQKRRRHAVRNLTLKSAPPVPTAPKDPKVRRRQWLLSLIKTHLSRIDVPFLALSVILCIVGLLSVNSATKSFDTSRYVIVQAFGVILGLLSALVLLVIDYRSFISKYRLIIGFNVALLLITYIFGSSVTEGTNSNWIDLGIIKIQPSEFAKLFFIYSFAVHLSQVRERMHKFSTVLTLGIHAAIIFGLVLLQRDLGSLTIFLVIFICMCFAAGISVWYYIAGGTALVCVSPFIWSHLNEYQKNRIMLCFDETIDPLGTGIRYQQLRSQTAIGNGGIFGTGYTQGSVTQGVADHLPAKHTDMIFSTFCEEWGFIGAITILILTSILIIRVFKIAHSCGNSIGRYICVGVASMLMIQVIENVGMCLGIMPVIGITYPFLSYGGSSILSCLLAVGMVLSVSTHMDDSMFK